MDLCYDCGIGDTLAYCCGSHPETGETKDLELPNGEIVSACPSLTPEMECSAYHDRPQPCRDYECHKFNDLDLVQIFS